MHKPDPALTLAQSARYLDDLPASVILAAVEAGELRPLPTLPETHQSTHPSTHPSGDQPASVRQRANPIRFQRSALNRWHRDVHVPRALAADPSLPLAADAPAIKNARLLEVFERWCPPHIKAQIANVKAAREQAAALVAEIEADLNRDLDEDQNRDVDRNRNRDRRQFSPRALRFARKSHGWSQADLAERTGIPQHQISRHETGLHEPSANELGAYADALGCSIGDLYGRF